jgi:hypothetical protein
VISLRPTGQLRRRFARLSVLFLSLWEMTEVRVFNSNASSSLPSPRGRRNHSPICQVIFPWNLFPLSFPFNQRDNWSCFVPCNSDWTLLDTTRHE